MRRTPKPPFQPSEVLRECTPTEAWELRAAWLTAFGASNRASSREVNAQAFLWHIFSAGAYPSAQGDDARVLYQQQRAAEFVVLSNDGNTAFVTDVLPREVSLHDYCVFPPNLAWTMAFTHEAGWLGPYFARHANFEQLNQANLARLEKRQEAARAREKGWG